MKTRVVNLRVETFDTYIGREGHGYEGTFGNPFSDEKTKTEAIKRYKNYFLTRVEKDAEFREEVRGLIGKRLGCFCKPRACHGDVIVEYLEQFEEDEGDWLSLIEGGDGGLG